MTRERRKSPSLMDDDFYQRRIYRFHSEESGTTQPQLETELVTLDDEDDDLVVLYDNHTNHIGNNHSPSTSNKRSENEKETSKVPSMASHSNHKSRSSGGRRIPSPPTLRNNSWSSESLVDVEGLSSPSSNAENTSNQKQTDDEIFFIGVRNRQRNVSGGTPAWVPIDHTMRTQIPVVDFETDPVSPHPMDAGRKRHVPSLERNNSTSHEKRKRDSEDIPIADMTQGRMYERPGVAKIHGGVNGAKNREVEPSWLRDPDVNHVQRPRGGTIWDQPNVAGESNQGDLQGQQFQWHPRTPQPQVQSMDGGIENPYRRRDSEENPEWNHNASTQRFDERTRDVNNNHNETQKSFDKEASASNDRCYRNGDGRILAERDRRSSGSSRRQSRSPERQRRRSENSNRSHSPEREGRSQKRHEERHHYIDRSLSGRHAPGRKYHEKPNGYSRGTGYHVNKFKNNQSGRGRQNRGGFKNRTFRHDDKRQDRCNYPPDQSGYYGQGRHCTNPPTPHSGSTNPQNNGAIQTSVAAEKAKLGNSDKSSLPTSSSFIQNTNKDMMDVNRTAMEMGKQGDQNSPPIQTGNGRAENDKANNNVNSGSGTKRPQASTYRNYTGKSATEILTVMKTCTQCRFPHTFNSREEAVYHLRKVHQMKFCLVCFESFSIFGLEHKQHFLNEHTFKDPEDKAPCPVCSIKHAYDGMQQHLSKAHLLKLENSDPCSSIPKPILTGEARASPVRKPNSLEEIKRFNAGPHVQNNNFQSQKRTPSNNFSNRNSGKSNSNNRKVINSVLAEAVPNPVRNSDDVEHNLVHASRKVSFRIPKKK